MKNSRLVLNIISMVANVLASLVFMLPVWYFSNTTTISSTTSSLTTSTINIFDYNKLNQIAETYTEYGKSLNLTFSKIFLICAIFTIVVALIFIILTLSTMIKRLPTYNKLAKTCEYLSIAIAICALISLIMSIIFTSQSTCTIISTGDLTYTLSFNITSGIYLFTIFEIAAGICGYIANNIKEDNIN